MQVHPEKRILALHAGMLLVICAFLYLPYLSQIPFFNRGEPREGLVVQEIFLHGNWLFPLKGGEEIPSKPPLFHWFGAVISLLSGQVNETTVRLPSALLATGGVLALYALGRSLFSSGAAFWAAVILATSPVYQTQAVSARVDMTLASFVTFTLVTFYLIYKGHFQGRPWPTLFYCLLGISILAKGPVGVALPILVIGAFLALRKRWDVFTRLFLDPKIVIALSIGVLWYGLALAQGGEAFFFKQIWHENLARFFVYGEGGTGHQKPVYYYLPYLFLQGLPWTLFLPLLVIDWIKDRFWKKEDPVFLAIWFLVIFVFFSFSAGKRPVYLLPLYPPLALAIAQWFERRKGFRKSDLWGLPLIGGLVFVLVALPAGAALLSILSGNLPSWLSAVPSPRLESEDGLSWIRHVMEQGGAGLTWAIAFVTLLAVLLAWDLCRLRLRRARVNLSLLCLLGWTLGQRVFVPEVAAARSYASFMMEVNSRVAPGDGLYLYGGEFDPAPVVFYRGAPVPFLAPDPSGLARKLESGEGYVIMAEREWTKARASNKTIPFPQLQSEGRGSEGDVPLVLLRGGKDG